MKFWLTALCFLPKIVDISAEVLFLPQRARVVEGNSIKFSLKSSDAVFATRCELNVGNNVIFINESTFKEKEILEIDKDHPDRIQWITLKNCEFILSNVTKKVEGKITLAYQFGQSDVKNISTALSVIALPSKLSHTMAALGGTKTIDCIGNSNANPSYCEIIDPQGHRVGNKCSYTIDPVRPRDEGKWICKLGMLGSIELFHHEVDLQLSKDEAVKGSLTTTDTFVDLRCELENSNSVVRWCRALRPNGVFVMLTEGNVGERYSSLSSMEHKTCGLQVALPLESNTDFGLWRIDIGFGDDDFTGCFFTLPIGEKITTDRSLKRDEQKLLKILTGSSHTFDCSVPWPIKYCYVRDPIGASFSSVNLAAKRMHNVGICRVEVKNITLQQQGRWTCGVSSKESNDDHLIHANIDVLNGDLLKEQSYSKTKSTEHGYLICKSPLERPLSYCRFVAPSGKGYNLEPHLNSSRISYYGNGLDKGDCGIRIDDILAEDVGNWTCVTRYRSQLTSERQAVFMIEMSRSEPAVALTIGMSIMGLMLLASLVIFISIKFGKRTGRANLANDNIRTPSIGSEEDLNSNRGRVEDYDLRVVNEARRQN